MKRAENSDSMVRFLDFYTNIIQGGGHFVIIQWRELLKCCDICGVFGANILLHGVNYYSHRHQCQIVRGYGFNVCQRCMSNLRTYIDDRAYLYFLQYYKIAPDIARYAMLAELIPIVFMETLD